MSGRSLPTGALPESLAIVGKYLVTANAAAGTVTVIDRLGWAVLGDIYVGRGPVRVIALSDTRAVVALNGDAEIAVVDLVRLRVIRHEEVLDRPDGLCLDPTGTFLAVISNAMDAALILRVEDWRLAATVATGDGPGSCTWLPPAP
jgi:DNA-binding beta-propeller fold protein YncE